MADEGLRNPEKSPVDIPSNLEKSIKKLEHTVLVSNGPLADTAKTALQGLYKNRKYDIPGRGSHEPLEAYLARVQGFMRRVWREAAESSRRKEYKCLLEWMDDIDRSEDRERRAAVEELRKVLVDLGIEISGFLVEYLLMVSAERVEDVEAVIGCLGIEDDSVITLCFAGVVEIFDRTVRKAKRVKPDPEFEAELFRMIAVEILRLEVAFRSPDLGMRLLSLTYNSMAHHLRDNVFKGKLAEIRDKIDGIGMEPLWRLALSDEVLNSQVKEIWQIWQEQFLN